MTEKEMKELQEAEKILTCEEYIDKLKALSEVVCGFKKGDKIINDTMVLIATALKEKYTYILDISRPFRRKKSAVKRMFSWLFKGEEEKPSAELEEIDKEPKPELIKPQAEASTNTALLAPEAPKQIEVIDAEGNKMLPGGFNSLSQALAEGEKRSEENTQKEEVKAGLEG